MKINVKGLVTFIIIIIISSDCITPQGVYSQLDKNCIYIRKKIQLFTVSFKRVKNNSVTSILYVGWPELIGKHPAWYGQQHLATACSKARWLRERNYFGR
jgi:hypothetical protein